LKAEIGRPRLEAIPTDSSERDAIGAVLARFGEPCAGAPRAVAVRLDHGAEDLAGVVRALDDAGVQVADLQLHAPSLDDVFLAKTGRSLEGAAEEGEPEALRA
jgi:ABC-2 type transport system ATP-binding protein